jgi:2-dehydro-3-deoxyglucarate aldolase
LLKAPTTPGATFVAVGSDLGVFRAGTQALCDKYRE